MLNRNTARSLLGYKENFLIGKCAAFCVYESHRANGFCYVHTAKNRQNDKSIQISNMYMHIYVYILCLCLRWAHNTILGNILSSLLDDITHRLPMCVHVCVLLSERENETRQSFSLPALQTNAFIQYDKLYTCILYTYCMWKIAWRLLPGMYYHLPYNPLIRPTDNETKFIIIILHPSVSIM